MKNDLAQPFQRFFGSGASHSSLGSLHISDPQAGRPRLAGTSSDVFLVLLPCGFVAGTCFVLLTQLATERDNPLRAAQLVMSCFRQGGRQRHLRGMCCTLSFLTLMSHHSTVQLGLGSAEPGQLTPDRGVPQREAANALASVKRRAWYDTRAQL